MYNLPYLLEVHLKSISSSYIFILFYFSRDNLIDHLQNELVSCQTLILQLKRKIILLEETLAEKVGLSTFSNSNAVDIVYIHPKIVLGRRVNESSS